MRKAHFRPARALWPRRDALVREYDDHHPGGFRASLSGDRRSPVRAGDSWLGGFVSSAGRTQPYSGTLSCGGQHAPWSGSADGGAIGSDGRRDVARGPRFDQPVPSGGYAWWYLDALSQDGCQGLTLIAFVGSVFSPYYAAARRRGDGDPLDHCALNVALYGPTGSRWTLTERGRSAVERSPDAIRVGPSSMSWDGRSLTILIDEVTAPVPSRVRGRVRVFPHAWSDFESALDAAGKHRWRPLAPRADVEVELTHPALRWKGRGYCDANCGDAPLEDAFAYWHWLRAPVGEGSVILYDVRRRDGTDLSLALHADHRGTVRPFATPPEVALPPTRWKIARATRAESGSGATVERTLEDTPFYARSIVSTSLCGERVRAMHESLSLARFRSRFVRALLPFRMLRSRR